MHFPPRVRGDLAPDFPPGEGPPHTGPRRSVPVPPGADRVGRSPYTKRRRPPTELLKHQHLMNGVSNRFLNAMDHARGTPHSLDLATGSS